MCRMNDKIVAFSLWGDSKLYCQGAIENVLAVQQYMPEWTCRFYISENCPVLEKLSKMDCQLIKMPPLKGIDRSQEWNNKREHIGATWRFYALSDASKFNTGLPSTQRVIFRDCDSRITQRDADVTLQWIESGYLAHTIYENYEHLKCPIMCGMWGIYTNFFNDIDISLEEYIEYYPQVVKNRGWVFLDSWFLTERVLPHINYNLIRYGFGMAEPIISNESAPIGDVICGEWREQLFI